MMRIVLHFLPFLLNSLSSSFHRLFPSLLLSFLPRFLSHAGRQGRREVCTTRRNERTNKLEKRKKNVGSHNQARERRAGKKVLQGIRKAGFSPPVHCSLSPRSVLPLLTSLCPLSFRFLICPPIPLNPFLTRHLHHILSLTHNLRHSTRNLSILVCNNNYTSILHTHTHST